MKATFISKEDGKARFTMEFTGEELETATVKAYQHNKDKFNVDGFRKGKAPRSIIERRYGEDRIFLEDAINYVFNDNYPKAVEDLDLEIINRPAVEFSQIKKGEDFTATVTVEVYPEIEVKDYAGVEIDKLDSRSNG
jgi:trigger factor